MKTKARSLIVNGIGLSAAFVSGAAQAYEKFHCICQSDGTYYKHYVEETECPDSGYPYIYRTTGDPPNAVTGDLQYYDCSTTSSCSVDGYDYENTCTGSNLSLIHI